MSQDFTAKEYQLPFEVIVVKALLLTIFFLVGFIGNSFLCIIVARNHETRTRTNIFYFNLAIANLGQAVVCIPFTLSTLFTGRWALGTNLCYVNGIANSFWISACTFSVTATTMHKYFSVVKPLKRTLTKRRVYWMLFVVWAASGLVCIWPIFRVEKFVYKPASGQCGFDGNNRRHEMYYLLFLAFAVFILPTFINAFCYARIFKALERHRRRIRKTSIIDESGIRAQRRTIITLYAVFVIFLITWLPFDIYSLFFILDKEALLPDWFLGFVYICAYSTSAQVPLIVIHRSVRLKEELKIIAKRLFCSLPCMRKFRGTRNKISFAEIDLDRRCSGWYIAGHGPVLQLTETDSKETRTPAVVNRTYRVFAIETCL